MKIEKIIGRRSGKEISMVFSDDGDDVMAELSDSEKVEEKIVAVVREWFWRMMDEKDRFDRAITLRLSENQGDEDGTLWLDCDVTESMRAEVSGRVPGRKF